MEHAIGAVMGVVGAPFQLLDTGFAMATAPLAAMMPAFPAATLMMPHLGMPYPFVADAETLARDSSTFTTEQGRLVELLLRTGRFRLAFEHQGLLLVHAGVTRGDLDAAGVDASSAAAAAAGLNAFLDERIAAWTLGPFELSPWHRAGSAEQGAARGALVHRPADPQAAPAEDFNGPPRRRFDPRELPSAFSQAIGHVRDNKCRQLMPRWCETQPAGVRAARPRHPPPLHCTSKRVMSGT